MGRVTIVCEPTSTIRLSQTTGCGPATTSASETRTANDPTNNSTHGTDPVVGWLISEAHRVGDHINAMLLAEDRMITFGAAVITVSSNVALARGAGHLLMALPLLVGLLVAYNSHVKAELYALGGYKAGIEEEITRRVGSPIVFWESQVACRHRHHTRSKAILTGYLALLWSLSIVISVFEAVQTTMPGHWGYAYRGFWVTTTCVVIVLTVPAGLRAHFSSTREHSTTRKVAVSALQAATDG